LRTRLAQISGGPRERLQLDAHHGALVVQGPGVGPVRDRLTERLFGGRALPGEEGEIPFQFEALGVRGGHRQGLLHQGRGPGPVLVRQGEPREAVEGAGVRRVQGPGLGEPHPGGLELAQIQVRLAHQGAQFGPRSRVFPLSRPRIDRPDQAQELTLQEQGLPQGRQVRGREHRRGPRAPAAQGRKRLLRRTPLAQVQVRAHQQAPGLMVAGFLPESCLEQVQGPGVFPPLQGRTRRRDRGGLRRGRRFDRPGRGQQVEYQDEGDVAGGAAHGVTPVMAGLQRCRVDRGSAGRDGAAADKGV